MKSAPWGLAGGHEGGRGDCRFSAGVEPFDHGSGLLRAGDIIEIITPGAGGYGPPERRDRALVARDLADRRISPREARDVYKFAG
jgi:N-methylhydantoinase B